MFKNLLLLSALSGAALLFGDATTDAAKKKVADGKYEEAIADLDAAFKKNPKSAEYKQGLAAAHFAQGNALMNNAQMPPFRKYPGALKSFRKTLEYDPNHKEAKANIKTIEDIYKSMGRPVPQ
jgi:tetratricopeptide (TPR) repeat protein